MNFHKFTAAGWLSDDEKCESSQQEILSQENAYFFYKSRNSCVY